MIETQLSLIVFYFQPSDYVPNTMFQLWDKCVQNPYCVVSSASENVYFQEFFLRCEENCLKTNQPYLASQKKWRKIGEFKKCFANECKAKIDACANDPSCKSLQETQGACYNGTAQTLLCKKAVDAVNVYSQTT